MSLLDGVFGVVRSVFNDDTELPAKPRLRAVGGISAVNNVAGSSTDLVLTATSVSALATTRGSYTGQLAKAEYHTTRAAGGGGDFIWDEDSNVTPNNGTIVGVGPGQWIRPNRRRFINVREFGAVGDGLFDDIVAMQAAVDYAIAQGLRVVRVPSGTFLTSRTLHLYKNVSLSSITLEGDGIRYDTGFGGTCISATFTDSPAIAISGARVMTVKNLTVTHVGYAAWMNAQHLGLTTNSGDTLGPAWSAYSSLSANADSRYAPMAGICIDGWMGTAPTPAYPTAYVSYGQAPSSAIRLENVQISGFVAGVACQPCNNNANGDFLYMDRVLMTFCKYGVSIGNSQSRNVRIKDCVFSQIWKVFVSNVHGQQNGRFQGIIDNCSFGTLIQLFDFGSLSIVGPLKFTQTYCEGIWRLGDLVTSTSAESALLFDGGSIEFHGQTDLRGHPATVLGGYGGTAVVDFNRVSFGQYKSVMMVNAPGARFDGCQFQSTEREFGVDKEYKALFNNATCDGLIFPNLRSYDENRIKFRQIAMSGALPYTSASPTIARAGLPNTSRTTCVPAWIQRCSSISNNGRDIMNVPRRYTGLDKTAVTVSTITQSSSDRGYITITIPGLTDGQAMLYGLEPGDCLLDSSTFSVFAIRARTATVITAELQNNYYKPSGGSYTCITAFDTTRAVGTMYAMNCRIYSPAYPLFVDVTSGSASLTSAGRDDGSSANVNSSIAQDDRIHIDEYLDNWVSYETGNKISAIDVSGTPITLTGNATKTTARRRLAFMIRKPPANEASR